MFKHSKFQQTVDKHIIKANKLLGLFEKLKNQQLEMRIEVKKEEIK
jgi:hypothetical protein